MDSSLIELVWRRASDRCEYCQVPQNALELAFEIDHIIARKHRGPSRAGNLCLACFACNNHKGTNIAGFDTKTQTIVRLFHPRRHKWAKHFRWHGPMLIGLTATGRVTVAVLEINLDYRVSLRQSLIDEGTFPPE
jgi:hypothetical protein